MFRTNDGIKILSGGDIAKVIDYQKKQYAALMNEVKKEAEKKNEHDCHISPEDGCAGCKEIDKFEDITGDEIADRERAKDERMAVEYEYQRERDQNYK